MSASLDLPVACEMLAVSLSMQQDKSKTILLVSRERSYPLAGSWRLRCDLSVSSHGFRPGVKHAFVRCVRTSAVTKIILDALGHLCYGLRTPVGQSDAF